MESTAAIRSTTAAAKRRPRHRLDDPCPTARGPYPTHRQIRRRLGARSRDRDPQSVPMVTDAGFRASSDAMDRSVCVGPHSIRSAGTWTCGPAGQRRRRIGWYWSRIWAGDGAMCVGHRARLRRATLGEVMFADVWLPGDQQGSPVPGPTRLMTPENRWSSPSGRPLASRGVTTPSATLRRQQRAW